MLRWGIVGFGWVARDFMAPGIAASGGQLAAVCDRDPMARRVAEALGAKTYADLSGMLGESLDAVYVATPNHLHREAVEACLAAGVSVLCEKPMAATLTDAEAMIAAAQGSGRLLGLALDQRHHPAHVAIRDAIADGILGKPTAIRILYGCWLDKAWHSDRLGRGANWRINAGQAGGGAVIDLAPHGLDLAHMLLGQPIVALVGLLQSRVQDYDVDDGGMLVGRTAGGVLVSVHNSYNTPETLPRRRLEIVGTRGQIVATDTMGQEPGGTVFFTDAVTCETRPIAFDGTLSPFAAQARAFAAAVRGEPHDFDPARDLAALRLLLSSEPTRLPEPVS